MDEHNGKGPVRTRSNHENGRLPDTAISVEGLTKIYKIGRRGVPGPKALGNLGKLLPGLRAEKNKPGYKDPGPLRTIAALRDVSFEVPRGTALGVAGPPGAGKSTLLRVLSRVSPPTEGRVVIRGRVAPALDLAPTFLDQGVTGRENAYRLAKLFGIPRSTVDERLDDIFTFAELTDKIDTTAQLYSSGEYRRLGFSIALNLGADVLIAEDRILAGDTAFAEHVRWRIATAHAGGLTLVLVSNEAETIREFCSEVIWMEEGQVVDRFPAERITEVQEAGRFQRRGDKGTVVDGPTLDTGRQTLIEMLLNQGHSYAEVAAVLRTSERQARSMAHMAVRAIAPPSVELSAERRGELLDYLLGQATSSQASNVRAALSESPPERAWASAVADGLAEYATEALPEIPDVEPEEPDGPELGRPAAALVKFLRIAYGDQKADEAAGAARAAAARKSQREVKWQHVATYAGLEHDEAKGIVERMLAEEANEAKSAGKRTIFNEHLAITSVELVSAEGDPAETIRFDEGVVLRIGVEAGTDDLLVGASIVISGGPETVRLSHPKEFLVPHAGAYRVTADLPSGLLVEGRYNGRVVLTTKQDRRKGVVQSPDAFELEVYDPRDPDDRADEDEEALPPGVDVSDVKWSVNLLRAAR